MIDLVACYWTVAGPVEIHHGREWSLFDWRTAATRPPVSGFRVSGSGPPTSSTSSRRERSRRWSKIFRDAGLKDTEIEFLQDFFRPEGSPEKAESDRAEEAAVRRRRGVRRPPHQGGEYSRRGL